jgi:hypothetical protein
MSLTGGSATKLLNKMKTMDKKAYLKTVEVLLAMLIGGAFIIYVIPATLTRATEQPPIDILSSLENNDDFRQLMLFSQTECVDAELLMLKFLPAKFKYSYAFSPVELADYAKVPSNLPKDRRVYADSIFLAGNTTKYKPVIVKLFYWVEK